MTPGAITLFQLPPHEHLSLAKHLTAEKKTEEFVIGKGVVTRWEHIRKNNHWFDALYNACAAGHKAGVRLLPDKRPDKPNRKLSEMAAEKRAQRSSLKAHWDGMRERWRSSNGFS